MRREVLFLIALAASGCTLDPVPPTIDFGQVYVGFSSPIQTAHWVNNGDQDTDLLALSTRQPYRIVNSGAFASSQTIVPGGSSATVQVQFAPTAAGRFPEEVRPVSQPVRAVLLQLQGEGVWAINEGAFSLENNPPHIVGSFDFSTYPIQPNQPIDWGTRQLGGPAVEAMFQLRNTGPAVNGTANARMLKGDQHFTIVFPVTHTDFNIGPIGGTGGTREIRVSFNPVAVGEWLDVIEVTDSANPNSRAGIVCKARVVAGD
ncbi:MAG: choice-of-anchor D domain-containing protein [Candidatus Omnitrophica bacterium]|nr:choice-of-anchor D domain-containing protein [Candidatus Omnitrophota bacterium]